jgi:hyperosmotically inducible protein
MLSRLLKLLIIVFALIMSLAPTAAGQQKPGLRREREPRAASTARSQALLAAEVRHRLVMLPYYDVFDWLEGEVRPDGTLVLRGQVVRPTLKSDAEASVRDIEGITRVQNEIEVLPLSPNDDQLRVALYRAIYKFDSPLFRYATRAVPPIHIIVRNGRATLKGVVATKADSDLAYAAARGVPGLFDVTNELRVEQGAAR